MKKSQFILVFGILVIFACLIFIQNIQKNLNFVYDINLVKYYAYDLYLQAKKALNNTTAFNNLKTNITEFCNMKMLNCSLNTTYLIVKSDSKTYIIRLQ